MVPIMVMVLRLVQPGLSDSLILCYDKGDFGPPFFMITKILFHPVTLFNLLTVGVLIMIQSIHLHAHKTMEIDADSYVYNFCKKNVEKCESFIDSDY